MLRKPTESVCVNYATKGKAAALSAGTTASQIAVVNARAQNNSGGAITVGIVRKLSVFKLWKVVGGVYTNVTATVQAGSEATIFTTTNNDGFVVQAPKKPNLIGMTISDVAASGVYTYKYYNGTTFTTLTTLEVPVYTSTGDVYIVAKAPNDWVVGGHASLDANMYSVEVIGTTGPASTGGITSLWCGDFLTSYDAVANNAEVQLSFPESAPFMLNSGEGLMPYFSTANAANVFGAFYKTF